jgi:hypothetical protein
VEKEDEEGEDGASFRSVLVELSSTKEFTCQPPLPIWKQMQKIISAQA